MEKGRGKWANKIIGVSMLVVVLVVILQIANGYFFPSSAVMHLAGHRFEARIADTERARTQGLSGTTDLPADEAMVFIFDYSNKWSIWMKDMNYPIDIVWLDESKKVIDFVTNVSPSSYPSKTYLPKEPALYVVELRSGIVQQKGIRIGQQAVFSGTSKEI